MDATDRVSIELIDAGDHKDRVVLVLSKVKGLVMSPQQIVQHTPCTVATDVPRVPAQKLKEYLEKAGAMVMLEGERRQEEDMSFTPDMSPASQEEPLESLEGADVSNKPAASEVPVEWDVLPESASSSESELFGTAENIPLPEIPVPAEASEQNEAEDLPAEQAPRPAGKWQQILAKLPRFGKKPTPGAAADLSARAETQPEAATVVSPPTKKSLAGLFKLKKQSETAPESPEKSQTEPTPVLTAPTGAVSKKIPDLLSNPATLFITGMLTGAVIAGLLGWLSIKSLQQERLEYEAQTAEQIEQHSAQLKNLVQQLSQEAQDVKQKNTTLETQMTELRAQLEEAARQPKEIIPTQSPTEGLPPEQPLIQSFQEVMMRHVQSLEGGYDAQKQAKCSLQVLLDGKATSAFAQVIKKFDAQFVRYDIRRSASLLAPYMAEFKIPFQQEIKTGKTEETCQAAKLQTLETPDHHEFGSFYGYWTVEYQYREGKWVVNTTVIERNRALYENSFQKGSPDYAKFTIDTNLFPAFQP